MPHGALNDVSTQTTSTNSPDGSTVTYGDIPPMAQRPETDSEEYDELGLTILWRQRAVDATPDGHPEEPIRRLSLGHALWTRFQRLNDLDDLDRAIRAYRSAVNLTPESQRREKPTRLDCLGISLFTRFRRRGELDDLLCAIAVQYLAVGLTRDSDRHTEKPARLDSLGSSLAVRFEYWGDMEDLETAIKVQRRACKLARESHPDKARFLNNLGNILVTRFQRLGDLDDLKSAIEMHFFAVKLTPDGHAGLPARLLSLGVSLRIRFERLYELDDLERAIEHQRKAVELTSDGHPERPVRVTSLGSCLSLRFMRLGDLDDLERAITAKQSAVDLTSIGDPARPMRLESLGISLLLSFEHTKTIDDLQSAIDAQELAVKLTPDEHPARPARLDSLGISLETRFQHLHSFEDLERAITMQQMAVDLTPPEYPERRVRSFNLGICLRLRFEHKGEPDDIDRAIAMQSLAVESTPKGHPQKVVQLQELGFSLVARFRHFQSKLTFDEAINCLMDVTMESLGNPTIRLESAQLVVSLLSKHADFGSAESLLLAHSHIIQVFPEIVWLGHSVGRRYKESAKLGALVNAAVSAFIGFNSRYQAIEWMETGRSLVWSQILSLRTPLDALWKKHPDLASRLGGVSQELRGSSDTSRSTATHLHGTSPDSSHDFAADAAVEHRRQLVIRYEHILGEVRARPGFENFLRPEKITSLMQSIERLSGPVVFINVDSSTCDALALFPNGSIKHIPLPNLTESGARILRATWIQCLHGSASRARGAIPSERLILEGRANAYGLVLGEIWSRIIHPILQAMGLIHEKPLVRLPHVTWCPTGPLTQLPLHAAGVYNLAVENRPHVFDFIVSSYTPSLSALLRCRDGLSPQPSEPDLLVIAQPETPGWTMLPGTREECSHLRAALPGSAFLEHTQATVSRTCEVLNTHSWIHFACHGTQHQTDPTQSAFALYDGQLTLSTLMGTVSDNSELAFLSACQTAVGDESIPEESVHLAAGMLAVGFKGVVATMWSITDADAPVVVQAYYRKLLEIRNSGVGGQGETGAAYALHDAVKVLRDRVGERSFVKWAPFVHFGL